MEPLSTYLPHLTKHYKIEQTETVCFQNYILKQRALKHPHKEDNDSTIQTLAWSIIFTIILLLHVCKSVFHLSSVRNQQPCVVNEPGQRCYCHFADDNSED